MNLLSSFTPDLEQVSIDECYLDFTGIAHRYSSPVEAADKIRKEIRDTLGFTVNIGISSCKLLAKMASDFTKPDRTHTLFPEEIQAKMWPLPVSELFMVGGSSAQRLGQYGIFTIGDLARTDLSFLQDHFKSHGRLMWEYANGIDDSPVISFHQEAKGVGNSTTLSQDVSEEAEACRVLLSLCEQVSGRLQKTRQLASTVTVEIKYADFTRVSHQTQLLTPCNTSRTLYEISCGLFSRLWDGRPIRLLGVRGTRLQSEDEPIQLSLFDLERGEESISHKKQTEEPVSNPPSKEAKKEGPSGPSQEKLQKLDAAMNEIRSRYGKDAVVRGSLLKSSPKKKKL